MQINGRKIEGPSVEVIVIPRSDGDLVFQAQAVLDYDEFEKICPEPVPPHGKRPGEKEAKPLYNDPGYKKKMDEWASRRSAWMMLQSLRATEGLTWETVDYNDPETWDNWDKEMQSSGLSIAERTMILKGILSANALDQTKIQEARERFFASRQQEQDDS